MLPLLPPLCCSHVSRFTVYDWNLHGKNFVQFLIHALLLQLLVGPIDRAHQLADQCSRIHVLLPRFGFLPRNPLKTTCQLCGSSSALLKPFPGTTVTAMPGAPAGFPELNFLRGP